jgi:SAM-dependent methyltransferase
MANDAYILNHYKKVAENFLDKPYSTIQDVEIRDAETNFIIQQINQIIDLNNQLNLSIADLGCGNGYLLEQVNKNYPMLKLYGLEFTPELYQIAHNRNLNNTKIYHGDIRANMPLPKELDIIITERVIINLLSWKQQQKALSNIVQHLKPGGFYIMVESYFWPWLELNQARKENKLPEIPVSKHNLYLKDKAHYFLEKNGMLLCKPAMASNYLSTHFFITRILHPIIKPEGGRRKYSHFADFFNQALPAAVGNYSPILFKLYQKKNEN